MPPPRTSTFEIARFDPFSRASQSLPGAPVAAPACNADAVPTRRTGGTTSRYTRAQ
jgi:hypothetical protein